MKAFVFVVFLIFSCARVEKVAEQKEQKKRLQVSDYIIRPGDVVRITFNNFDRFQGHELYCKDRTVYSQVEREIRWAIVAESYFSDLKPFACKMGDEVVARFKVQEKDFHREKLNVPKKMVYPSSKDRKRIREEQEFLNRVYASSPRQPFFRGPFVVPLDTFVTSVYGTKRLYNNSKESQHLGTDFRAEVGRPVRSAHSGKVVVSRNLYYTGNTVTLDHGSGIFSIYGHLSKTHVKEGELVGQGMVVGLSGATGRVTGPHLHWGVKVNGHFVDGHSLVKEGHKFRQ